MEVQWDDDEKLEEILERRRMEGSSLQAEGMQKILELVVHERMFQDKKGERVRRTEVKGWSTEEMKNKPSSFWEEETEEMIGWRSVSQEEMDQCWKKLAEKIEEEVLDRYKSGRQQKRSLQRLGLFVGMEACAKEQKYKSEEKIVGQEFSLCSEKKTCGVCKACMRIDGGRRDEAAEKNETCEGYVEED